MKKPKSKWYVGSNDGELYLFKSDTTPTEETHGHLFKAVIGVFKTKRGAVYMAKYGLNNPHLLTVADAEYYAKREAINERQIDYRHVG